MLKKIHLVAALLIAFSVSAQKSKVISTYNYLKSNELEKAKEAIDEATTNETSSDYWKTYFYRGEVYYNLALTQNEEYKNLAQDPILESYKAYTKVYDYDSKKIDKNDLNRRYKDLIAPAFNGGVTAFNEGEYDKAIEYFNVSRSVYKKFDQVDSLSIYNIALAADRKGDAETAEQYYRECIDIGYKPAMMYFDMSNIYLKAGNEEKALEILNEAREKFPNDQNLLTSELNIYLKNEKYDEALGNLDVAIQNDPDNYIFYYARGTIYNGKGETGKAEEDYKKAVELKPDYFDAYYNLGALYFNEAVELNNQANEVPANQPEEYEKKKKIAVDAFEKALPFLEKAHELKPDDVNTMTSLKQLYALTKKTEKYQEMSKKLSGE